MTTIVGIPTIKQDNNNKINNLKDCFVCCNEIHENNFFKCLNCDFEACIDCNKKVLLDSINDPHCMQCKAIIPYDEFLEKFNKKSSWALKIYKTHKETILFNREKNYFTNAINEIATKKKVSELMKERDKFYKEYIKQIKPINDQIAILSNKKNTKNKYSYKYACPIQDCLGFLNEEFKCDLCDSQICNKCYVKIDFIDNVKNHECNEEHIESFKQIKKEAKPCPKCGEFISKIDGCDQMFCIINGCGTAFSWKTGIIESGVVHNPHAHQWFNQNPEARDMYINNINNRNRANGCRDYVPILQELTKDLDTSPKLVSWLRIIHRSVSEFRQYYRTRYINFIQTQDTIENENKDLRMKFLEKNITLKHYKSHIHKRDKERQFKTNIFQLLIIMYETTELYLWEITNDNNINNNINTIKIYDNMVHLKNSTNIKIDEIKKLFGYSRQLSISDSFRGFPYH